MALQILPTTEAHIEGFRLALDAVARERRYLGFLEAPPLEATQRFVRAILREGRPHFVALVKGQVIGWCDVSAPGPPAFAHSGVLGMGIIDGHRGQGIGTALITAALNNARETGLTRIELTVHRSNLRAQRLYKKMGLVEEGVKRNGVYVDGRYEDLICMAILFD